MNNAIVPDMHPTTSDIGEMMQELGFQWSNEAQVFFHENAIGYEYLSRKTAERLYGYLIGSKPYNPIKE